MKSVAFHNLGCKVNSYEIDVMQQKMCEQGFTIVDFDEFADIYVINTCSVTNIADRKSRQMLHRAKAMNPDGIVVAVGCYVQTSQDKVEADSCIDLAIGNNRKGEIAEIILQYIQNREQRAASDSERHFESDIIDINHTDEYEEMQLSQTAEHTRAYIKIQDGCNQFCSYCIIPFARGRVRSRKQEDILTEIRNMVAAGYREVVITGIHLSSYGIDFEEKITSIRDYMETTNHLPELLEAVNAIEGLERIRLGSLEPRIITETFLNKLRGITKLCPHFHLSLQSGCDATLERMNRHYTTQEYEEKVKLLRSFFPDCAVTTDVIVGFPGETEEEFETTREYLESLKLYEMHIFKYSKRQGTKAAVMPNQLTEAEKEQRSAVLLNMTEQNSAEFRRHFIGKKLSVLLEDTHVFNGVEYRVGYSREYVQIAVAVSELRGMNSAGSIMEVIPYCEMEGGKSLKAKLF